MDSDCASGLICNNRENGRNGDPIPTCQSIAASNGGKAYGCVNSPSGQNTSPVPTTPANNPPNAGNRQEGQTCDKTTNNPDYTCAQGLECRRTSADPNDPYTCQKPRNNPSPLFTKLVLIKNENGDFNNADTYTSFSYTDDQAQQNAGTDLIIPYFALSDGEGRKTITVRFCPSASASDNLCKEVNVAVNLIYPKTTPPSVQSVDQGVNEALNKLRSLGKQVTLTDNGFTISDGTVNLPNLNQIPDEDLEYLVYVLKAKLKIHPYFALCQYFTSSQDIKRLESFLDKYGTGAPIMPAVWTKAQLQAMDDPRYAAALQYLPDGRGPMPLPCKFDASRPQTYAIFPRLVNAPPQFNRNDLAIQGSGLDLVSPNPDNSNEVNNFQQKLTAYVVLEQLTWQAADIPIGKAVDWLVKMGDLMPITDPLGQFSLLWKYILPGETIQEALNLRDKGAPLGYVGARYGAKIVADLVLLVGPIPFSEGKGTSIVIRIGSNIARHEYVKVAIDSLKKIRSATEFATKRGKAEFNQAFSEGQPVRIIKLTYRDVKFPVTLRRVNLSTEPDLLQTHPRYRLIIDPNQGFNMFGLISYEDTFLTTITQPDGTKTDLLIALSKTRWRDHNPQLAQIFAEQIQEYIRVTGNAWKEDLITVDRAFAGYPAFMYFDPLYGASEFIRTFAKTT